MKQMEDGIMGEGVVPARRYELEGKRVWVAGHGGRAGRWVGRPSSRDRARLRRIPGTRYPQAPRVYCRPDPESPP